MIDKIQEAFADLKRIEDNVANLELERNDLRFENERLRRALATALATIEDLKREESPHV